MAADGKSKPVRGRRVVMVAGGVSGLGVLPIFMLGGLAVFMRPEIAIGDETLGLLVALFFGASSLASIPGGHFAERYGPRASVVLAATLSGTGLIGIAALVSDVLQLVPFVALSGAGNGLAQPTSNLLLARGVRPARQGTAFGLKQASSAASTLLVGAAVALLVGPLGWRGAYGVWAGLAVALILAAPSGLERSRPRPPGTRLREGDASLRAMVWLTIATGIGAAIGTAMASFFIPYAVDAGIGPGRAGAVLTVASIGSMFARAGLGIAADRMVVGHLQLVGRCVLVGAVGFLGFAVHPQGAGLTMFFGLAVLLVFLVGWGWHGLFNYAVARWNPNAPGAAAAIIGVGVFSGGVIGPVVFGVLADRVSYQAAWWGTVVASVICYASLRTGSGLLEQELPTRSPA